YLESKKEMHPKWSDEMPDLAVEVLSPNDDPNGTTVRLNRFLDKGSAVVWMVDPDEKTVTIWSNEREPIVFRCGDNIANVPELPHFHCPVSEFFRVPGIPDEA